MEGGAAMADIFISYAREDKKAAQRLADALETLGWSVWWDRDLLAGGRFHQEIARELAKARAVVVLWSRMAVNSDWVLDEAGRARNQDKLAPALIEAIELPLGFGSMHTPSLIGWRGDAGDEGFRQLTGAIGRLAGLPNAGRGLADVDRSAPLAPVAAKRRRWPLWLGGALALMAGLGALSQLLGPSAPPAVPPAAPPLPAAGAARPAEAPPAATSGCTWVVDDAHAPTVVRNGPGQAFAATGQVAKGAPLTVVEQRDGWLRLTQPVPGWVAAEMTREVCAGGGGGGRTPGRFPQTSLRLLTDSELASLNAADLRLMRNEIFARHGFVFKDAALRQYFGGQAWYQPRAADVRLTPIEQANVNKIQAFENR